MASFELSSGRRPVILLKNEAIADVLGTFSKQLSCRTPLNNWLLCR